MVSNTLLLVNESENIHLIEKSLLKNSKVFSFNIESHKHLEKLHIVHKIAEDYLSEHERIKFFDLVTNMHNWYEKIPELKELEFKGTNLLGLLDTVELHTYMMHEVINFFTVKKIIEIEKPDFIITSANLSKTVKSLVKNDVKLEIYSKNYSKKLQWDEITIKQNIGGFPFSFNISRSNYLKIKKIWEKIICSVFDLWLDFKKLDQKTILFLEFYPPLYRELLLELQKNGFNIIFLNRRKPAIYDLQSINLLKKLRGKIINYDDLLDSSQIIQIKKISDNYTQKLVKVFSNDKFFEPIFLFEGYSLWNIVKEKLFESFKNRMYDYVFLLDFSNKLFEKIPISCILTLNEIGETEKSILSNKNKTPSILLEHGFGNFFPDSARFNILANYSNFKDKIAVWSMHQKNFLVKFHGIDSKRILVTGSPRHDILFNRNSQTRNNFTVLIAPTPITQIQGFDDTKIYLKFESVINKICSELKKYNVKIIVKLHPSQSFHNKIIQQTIKQFDRKIPIHLLSSVSELIETSDAVITITPEGWAPSTIILESLILKKPIMNIVLDDHFYDFPFVQQKAVFTVSPDSKLDENISKLLFDTSFRNQLITNGEKFVHSFLHKPMHASECLSNEINSILETN